MNKKTPIWQIVLLVALLGVLGFAMFRAFSGAMSPARPAPAAPAAGGSTSTATNMPDVVPTTSRGRLGEEGVSTMGKAAQINPNLFKVYKVSPPKNPFVDQEAWYADKLETIPGYPELTESDFFETMDPYVPNIPFIMDNPDEWSRLSLSRSQQNSYSIGGTSADGQISTQISLEKDIPTQQNYSWEKGSKIPLSALTNPEFVKDQIRQGLLRAEAGETPDEGSLFDESGLPIPGMDTVTGSGDAFACYGVSVNGSKSSALILYNGAPRIVTEGMVLPTHYEVLEINGDGVVLVDIKTGFSIHVPLGGEPAPTV